MPGFSSFRRQAGIPEGTKDAKVAQRWHRGLFRGGLRWSFVLKQTSTYLCALYGLCDSLRIATTP
ncbi:MAG: hypothetical protein A4E28_00947 [Methanocella sp. PtaU1.Bin125]|nr:MAG: hypothetical protein A4E28_00947 [Methanocella sp. PtaU1.Bin125]